ncbi:hypothetical protein [Chania multitudinisentens]|uniref:Rz1-like lysis system protein LysC n=1 Tax=Chania multitudinisentens TaxID=1639108 RepID=UPI0005F33A03|nr:hypothetical protein [Chania multitudinisentens]
MLFLSSCAQPPPPPSVLQPLPPETVFTRCEKPLLSGNTWGDAVSYTLALQMALQTCAGQVEMLNAWRSGLTL